MTNINHVILKWEGGKNGNAVLFLPDQSANMGKMVCYAHMGQHSEAAMGYYWDCKNPKGGVQMADALQLFREYQNQFPDQVFKVIKRDTDKLRKERYTHANR